MNTRFKDDVTETIGELKPNTLSSGEAVQPPIPPEPVPFLDRMLDPDQAARWLGMKRRELDEKRRKRQIPAIELGQRTVRYHPRTVIEFFNRAAR